MSTAVFNASKLQFMVGYIYKIMNINLWLILLFSAWAFTKIKCDIPNPKNGNNTINNSMETEPLIIFRYYYKPSDLNSTSFAKDDINIDNKSLLMYDLWQTFYEVLKKMDFQKRKNGLKRINKRNNQPRTLKDFPDYKCEKNNTSQENSPNGTKKCYNITSFLSQHWRIVLDININLLQESSSKDCPTSIVTPDVHTHTNKSNEGFFVHSSTSPYYNTNPIEIGTTFNYNTNPTEINSTTPSTNLREIRTTLFYNNNTTGMSTIPDNISTLTEIGTTPVYNTHPTEINSTTPSTIPSEMSTIADYSTDPIVTSINISDYNTSSTNKIDTTLDYNTNTVEEINSTTPSNNPSEMNTISYYSTGPIEISNTFDFTNSTKIANTSNYNTNSTEIISTTPSINHTKKSNTLNHSVVHTKLQFFGIPIIKRKLAITNRTLSKNSISHPTNGTTVTTPMTNMTFEKPLDGWSFDRTHYFGEHLIAILIKSSYTYSHNKTI